MAITDEDAEKIAGKLRGNPWGPRVKKLATLGGPLHVNKKYIKERMLGGYRNVYLGTGSKLKFVHGSLKWLDRKGEKESYKVMRRELEAIGIDTSDMSKDKVISRWFELEVEGNLDR